MSSIKKIVVYISVLLFAGLYLSSCNEDNFDITDPQVEVTPPDTLQAVEMTGRIVNENQNPIANAQVHTRLNGNDVTLTTDVDGFYRIPDVPEGYGRMHFFAEAEGYVPTDKLVIVHDQTIQKDITLMPEGASGYGVAAQPSLSSTVYKLSGRLLREDGSPADNREIFLVNFFDPNVDDWRYTYTDADGSWEIVTEGIEGFQLLAIDDCRRAILIDEDVSVIDQDVDLGDFISEISAGNELSEIRFRGTVTECDSGEPISRGSVRVVFDSNLKTWDAEIRDGQYDFVVRNCDASTCYTITIGSFLSAESITSSCQPIISNDIVEDFSICEDPIEAENDGNLSVFIDGQTISFPFVQIEEESSIPGLWLLSAINDDADKLGVLQFRDLVDGQALVFGIANFDGEADYLTTENDEVNVVIDSTTATAVYGSFSGTVTAGISRSQTTVSATFKAIFK